MIKRGERLYHFTSRLHWHFIEREGIDRGEAPTSARDALNHPNLTSDPDPAAQAWCFPRPGMDPSLVIRKNVVRVEVVIPRRDNLLVRWRDFAKHHGISGDDFRELNATGGGGARNWWIYRGTVRPARFVRVDFLDGGELNRIERFMLGEVAGSTSYDDLMARLGAFRDGRGTCLPFKVA